MGYGLIVWLYWRMWFDLGWSINREVFVLRSCPSLINQRRQNKAHSVKNLDYTNSLIPKEKALTKTEQATRLFLFKFDQMNIQL